MRVVGVIPARYQSSRFPGKPLADICGKPMIWWVYQQAKKVRRIAEVYVATDDERIQETCNDLGIPVVMTSVEHRTHIDRVYEFSDIVDADVYVVICGDEPLISSDVISAVIPKTMSKGQFIARALMREFTEPTEVIDPANIKISVNDREECIYLSRSPIPFPYKTVLYRYRKIVGVECYNKAALQYFTETPVGRLEKIEDITLLRFIENKKEVYFTLVETDALSVDTERDLEKVRTVIQQRTAQKEHQGKEHGAGSNIS